MAAVMLLIPAGIAVAQDAAPAPPSPEAKFTTPEGYASHHTIDMGGRMTNLSGSSAMYDTLVNLQSGPRVQGETFEMHALPGNKHSLADGISAFGTGFGGDPNIMARLNAFKGKAYEFSGVFRRDRLFSNYDLLANPNLPGGQSIPIGPSNARTGSLAWPLVNNSPVMFNTVRRMTDTNLTLRPLDTFTYRFAFSHSTMEGPTLSPSYTLFGMKYNALLRQYERNGNDNFMGGFDWKPSPATRISFEMQANHYKSDTYYTLDPNGFLVQEGDGTPAYLGNFTSLTPYGIAACNTASSSGEYSTLAGSWGRTRPSLTQARIRQATIRSKASTRCRCSAVLNSRCSTPQPFLSARCHSSMPQRRQYHCTFSQASPAVVTGKSVRSIQSMGSVSAGGSGSWTQTACRVSGGQLFLQPTAGAVMVTVAQRTWTVAVRAGWPRRRGSLSGRVSPTGCRPRNAHSFWWPSSLRSCCARRSTCRLAGPICAASCNS